jgi:guanosine-3',5'-bis(diphosphate) 3'-pyrophosphohydrolase
VAHAGPEVRALVAEVTDDKRLPKAERKRRQVLHAAHVGPAGSPTRP